MKTRMYTVFDRIAQESGQIFHSRSDQVAARALAKQLANEDRPGDFVLLYLGDFDHDKAQIAAELEPKEIEMSVVKEFIKEKNE